MTVTDGIYDAVDDFGLITSTEAKEIGVPNTDLVQQARRGKLVRVARCHPDDPVRIYDGVPSQPVADAIASAVATMGVDRAMDAAEGALKQGCITKADHDRLREELGA